MRILRLVVSETRQTGREDSTYDHIVWVGEREYHQNDPNGKKKARSQLRYRAGQAGHDLKTCKVEEVEINEREW